MSFFQCDSNQVHHHKHSQPTIPLILKGKKKIEPTKPISRLNIQPSSIALRNISPFPPQQRSVITTHVPMVSLNQSHQSPVHPRAVSVQRPIVYVQVSGGAIQNIANRSLSKQTNTRLERSQVHDIRRRLDENLSQVFKTIHDRRYSLSGPAGKFPRPKLNDRLVEEYIQQIYRDYSIPDPLAHLQLHLQHQETERQPGQKPSVTQSIITQPNRNGTTTIRRTQGIMSNSTNKKAVQLKESFLIDMFSPASVENGNSNNTQMSNNTNHREPVNMFGTLRQGGPDAKEVKETYRYCFICEQQILQANIDIHEKQRCPQFRNLYKMSLPQLRILLLKKIQRIRHQTNQIYKQLFENPNRAANQLQRLQQEGKRFLEGIDRNIQVDSNVDKQISDDFWQCELKPNFNSVMQCFEADYFKMFEYCRKLQWFVVMLRNLQSKYYGKEQRVSFMHSIEITKNLRDTEPYDRNSQAR